MRVSNLVLVAALASAWVPPVQAASIRHRARYAAPRHVFHGAYHIPRFDQAEAEAEVHTQYLYRTPYLPYWVFP